jgi:hypothetical protein
LKLVEFLSSDKTARYFVETGLVVPARIKESQLLNNSEHNQKAFLNAIKYSQNTPVNKDYKKLTDKLDARF